MDVFSKEKRKVIMSKIRAKDTKPEIIIRKFIFSKGFRYRKNVKALPGKPDIVMPKYKTVVLVNGCFWHGHVNCQAATLPKSRIEYWAGKINSNIERDKRNNSRLKKMGWRIITVWECEIKKMIEETKGKSRLEKLILK